VPVVPDDDGTNKAVVLPPTGTQQLFRLQWP
jgi:hypothetical protein